MTRRRQGFTLIELLMVMLIIGILMALLLPAVSAVNQAVRVSATQGRIVQLENYISRYKTVFGAVPPSSSPTGWVYPRYPAPDGTDLVDLFERSGSGNQPLGGQYLVYFLLGPGGGGWEPARHGCASQWPVSNDLASLVTDDAVGFPSDFSFYYFADAFERKFYVAGCIQYAVANPRKRNTASTSRFCDAGAFTRVYALQQAYYITVRRNYDWGDGMTDEHIKRTTDQCPGEFILISAGPNGKFGYYWWDGSMWRADYQKGITDDIANCPLE